MPSVRRPFLSAIDQQSLRRRRGSIGRGPAMRDRSKPGPGPSRPAPAARRWASRWGSLLLPGRRPDASRDRTDTGRDPTPAETDTGRDPAGCGI